MSEKTQPCRILSVCTDRAHSMESDVTQPMPRISIYTPKHGTHATQNVNPHSIQAIWQEHIQTCQYATSSLAPPNATRGPREVEQNPHAAKSGLLGTTESSHHRAKTKTVVPPRAGHATPRCTAENLAQSDAHSQRGTTVVSGSQATWRALSQHAPNKPRSCR